ncbi:MAG TPA: exosome complex protein Rrp42 [Candidatus Thermoplasmatota archaeon]|nr:exosome complex protein Rrp42 [Candidatus Thermoplasmatota archaeon]
MAQSVVADIRRDYVESLVRDGKRTDGRAFDQFREVRIQPRVVGQAEGSARVQIGETEVFAGVKIQPGTPYPDQPATGVMTTSAELIPMASPDFEAGPPRPESIELARVVDRGIRETDTIALEKMCITPGEEVWMVYIDLHIVDYDGNLFDAASLAAMGALLSAKVPAAKYKKGDGVDFPLPIQHTPISVTHAKIGNGLVVDPNLLEDQVAAPRLTVAVDENGLIRAMQKGLAGTLTKDEVLQCVRTARIKGEEIRAKLLEAVR